MKKIFHFLLSLLYPPRCIACKKECHEKQYVCDACCARITRVTAQCKKCGRPLRVDQTICMRCKNKSFFYDTIVVAYHYEDPVRSLLKTLKYHNRKDIADFLATLLATHDTALSFLKTQHYDYVMPVPMHTAKEKQRGYNQAFLLAERVAHCMAMQLTSDVLVRDRATKPLFDMNKQEREQELLDAFVVTQPEHVKGKRILMIDDIITTGTTLNECAKALKLRGAIVVDGFAFARGR